MHTKEIPCTNYKTIKTMNINYKNVSFCNTNLLTHWPICTKICNYSLVFKNLRLQSFFNGTGARALIGLTKDPGALYPEKSETVPLIYPNILLRLDV